MGTVVSLKLGNKAGREGRVTVGRTRWTGLVEWWGGGVRGGRRSGWLVAWDVDESEGGGGRGGAKGGDGLLK